MRVWAPDVGPALQIAQLGEKTKWHWAFGLRLTTLLRCGAGDLVACRYRPAVHTSPYRTPGRFAVCESAEGETPPDPPERN